MVKQDPEELVGELTAKLEQLKAEKGELERALEGDNNLTIRLQTQLSLLLPRSTSRSRSSAASSCSTSFSSSPTHVSLGTSPTFSTALQGDPTDLSAALVAALQRERALQRENQELRTAFQRAAKWRGELYELRRRCGISVEELAELESDGRGADSPGGKGPVHNVRPSTSSSPPSFFASHSRRRSIDTSSSSIGGYSTSASTSRSRYAGSIANSTTLTTPSTSYPAPVAPFPSPSSNSLSPFHAALSGSGFRSGRHTASMALDFEDLLPSPPGESESGGVTPLSASPGSRSGSLSRRPSSLGEKARSASIPSTMARAIRA